MNWEAIDQAGATLRSLGHRRSELVEAIQWAWERGEIPEAARLVTELGSVSRQCQEWLDRQFTELARGVAPLTTEWWADRDAAHPPEV